MAGEVKYDEYKGKPTIGLPTDKEGKYFFTFGVGKAKLILEHIDEIKRFVIEHEKKGKSA